MWGWLWLGELHSQASCGGPPSVSQRFGRRQVFFRRRFQPHRVLTRPPRRGSNGGKTRKPDRKPTLPQVFHLQSRGSYELPSAPEAREAREARNDTTTQPHNHTHDVDLFSRIE